MPDPLTLSEAGWFAIDWPLADLRAHYLDSRLDEMRREHAFWRYWSGWLKASGNTPVPRSTLEEILAAKEWQSPVGEVIATLVRRDRVELVDAAWILNELPAGWAHDQVSAFLLLADSSVKWAEKL